KIIAGFALENRIVVHKFEQFLGSESKSRYDLPRLEVLPSSGKHAGLDQRNHAFGNQFTVNAQVFTVHEEWQNRIRNATNAGLQYGPIFNEARYVPRDCYVHVSDHRLLEFA